MDKLLMIILLCLCTNFSSTQNIQKSSLHKIENQFFINGTKIDICENFLVSLKDNKGNIKNIPVRGTYINLRRISKKSDSYEIIFQYENYKLNVELYTKYIIPKERTIWNWSITTDSLQQKVIQECNLKVDYVKSEIEMLWPTNCCMK